MRVFLVFLFLFFSTSTVNAWSYTEHRFVCALAKLDLQKNNRDVWAKVEALIADNPWGITDFVDFCVFADEIKRPSDKRFTPAQIELMTSRGYREDNGLRSWHYVNVAPNATKVQMSDCDEEKGCILRAMDTHHRQLTTPGLEKWQYQDALLFLSHWIGDLHQPLHVGFERDRGGNQVYLDWYLTKETVRTLKNAIKGKKDRDGNRIAFPRCSNLHAVWDGCIMSFEDPDKYAETIYRLYGRLDQFRSGDMLAWANESLAILLSDPVYCKRSKDGCKKVKPIFSSSQKKRDKAKIEYEGSQANIAGTMLIRASMRLSMLIEQASVHW